MCYFVTSFVSSYHCIATQQWLSGKVFPIVFGKYVGYTEYVYPNLTLYVFMLIHNSSLNISSVFIFVPICLQLGATAVTC